MLMYRILIYTIYSQNAKCMCVYMDIYIYIHIHVGVHDQCIISYEQNLIPHAFFPLI